MPENPHQPPTSSRPSFTALLLVLVTSVLMLLLVYVGSYLWLGVRIQGQTQNLLGSTIDVTQVIYKHDWQIRLFGPAARVESLVTGRHVSLHRWEEFVSP
jgi:hypothetical protein